MPTKVIMWGKKVTVPDASVTELPEGVVVQNYPEEWRKYYEPTAVSYQKRHSGDSAVVRGVGEKAEFQMTDGSTVEIEDLGYKYEN